MAWSLLAMKSTVVCRQCTYTGVHKQCLWTSDVHWCLVLVQLVFIVLFAHCTTADEYNGHHLGTLPDFELIGLRGDVYAVNRSCLQIIGFVYDGQAQDLYFWIDKAETSGLSRGDGIKLPTFESGYRPLNYYSNARVVLNIPNEQHISQFRDLGVFSPSSNKDFGSIRIPRDFEPPSPHFLDNEFDSRQYEKSPVQSGPILIVDRRTVKIYGFKYNGETQPNAFFFVGKEPIRKKTGVKVQRRGQDRILPLQEVYNGREDVVITLPVDHDIYSIDYISVYWYRFSMDFGSVTVRHLPGNIPPYVPPQKWFNESLKVMKDPWQPESLLGNVARRDFHFQLGPPGHLRGYLAFAHARSPIGKVWYVNGYMAPEIWLQRGVKYTFHVYGGKHDPLYFTTDYEFGGYEQLPANKERIQIIAGKGAETNRADGTETFVGGLCEWTEREESQDADLFDTFVDYKRTLLLHCDPDSTGGVFTWTPNADTPGVLYYQSYRNFNMGWKILIVDDMPDGIDNMPDEIYTMEDYMALAVSSGTIINLSSLCSSVNLIVLALLGVF